MPGEASESSRSARSNLCGVLGAEPYRENKRRLFGYSWMSTSYKKLAESLTCAIVYVFRSFCGSAGV